MGYARRAAALTTMVLASAAPLAVWDAPLASAALAGPHGVRADVAGGAPAAGYGVALPATAPLRYASASVAGGAQAPSSPVTGGREYGIAAATSASRPVVSALSVPHTASAGRPPRVTLRVDEWGVGTVYVQVLVSGLTTHHAVVRATLGWTHTGRTVAVRWPTRATIAPGDYLVSVNAHDHHGHTLPREAHSSGRASLTVTAPPPSPAPPQPATPAPPPGTPPTAPSATIPPGVPTPQQTAQAGAVFPVRGTHSFGGPENRFGATREGHVHQGQDVLTTEGTPVAAPLPGTIAITANQPGGAGYYVVENATDGFALMFAHCQAASFAVAVGQAVGAGQALCTAGQTGDATAPHLHFEMWVGGWQAPGGRPIDPLPYLQAWDGAGG